jgi:hypothetical protein
LAGGEGLHLVWLEEGLYFGSWPKEMDLHLVRLEAGQKLLAGGGRTTLWSLAGVEGLHFGYWLEENFFTLLRNWKMKEYTMYGVQLEEEGTWAL